MNPKVQTSFIPKSPVASVSFSHSTSGRINIFLVVAVIIFIVSIVAALGVFIYQRSLVSSISDMSTRLAKARDEFELGFLDEVYKLNSRIGVAKELLGTHVAPSAIFSLLEETTLSSIRFRSMSLSGMLSRDITIALQGEANSYNSIALQSDVFGSNPAFKDPIVSDFGPDERGNVSFDFNAVIDPSFISYRKTISASGIQTSGKSKLNEAEENADILGDLLDASEAPLSSESEFIDYPESR